MDAIDTAQTLLSFLVAIVSAGSAAFVVIWRLSKHTHTIEARFQSHGERIGAVEKRQEVHDAALASIKEVNQQQEFKLFGLEKSQAEVGSKLDRIMELLDSRDSARHREDIGTTERLTRIETQLEISNQLREIANQLHARNGGSNG